MTGSRRGAPGATEDVTFELSGIGYAFPPGHRIRLALSCAHRPWIWPQPDSSFGFTVDPCGSALELPVRARAVAPPLTSDEPEQYGPLGVAHPATLDEPRPERLAVRDVAKGDRRPEADPRCGGTRMYPDGLEFTEDALETYTVREDDPLPARSRSDWPIRQHRPELAWDTTIRTRSETACTAEHSLTLNRVICTDSAEVVFHRAREKRIPRTAS
ncbi:CocE/NonD family hydrolase C-terminal non-catalytic domain-containing protein [Streptomyces sp. NPDC047706]|uniref:CocE/NonD family hydrolase C-terminal non-catalytic domain-containing protein n=1 Tax=Streptomyces sp. NPDC047706 TaxID=3365486 RepID=UPI0037126956